MLVVGSFCRWLFLPSFDRQFGNSSYRGSWGFATLGGAGGQTVFGALATGTHGGDFRIAPMADSVMAMHLVADGGKHYWIEPESLTPLGTRVADDDLLTALYGQRRYGGRRNFEIIRDDDVFNSVLISVGRFGIVYSIVMAAVRQYCLHQLSPETIDYEGQAENIEQEIAEREQRRTRDDAADSDALQYGLF